MPFKKRIDEHRHVLKHIVKRYTQILV